MKSTISHLLLFILCAGATASCTSEEASTPAEVTTDIPPQGGDSLFVCRYDNPFSDEYECKEYHGGWTAAAVDADCGEIFTGVAGTVNQEACDQNGAKGTCSVDGENGLSNITYYYGGDLEVTASMCQGFLSGTWEGEGGSTTGPEDNLDYALRSMVSNQAVTVEPECVDDTCLAPLVQSSSGIWFRPTQDAKDAGFIFYPGGGVDPRAYAPLAQRLAETGITVAIVPMPGNFAISGLNRATNIISAAPEINNWFLSGHSAGGAAAISYARQNDSTLSGLILLGAYGAASDDLSESSLPVVSIYGTEDGVVTLDEIETSKRTLPASTLYIPLFGGNHAQFGYYGEQSGDNEAFIDHAHQHHLMAGAIHHFIKQSLYAELVDQHPGFAAAHDVGIQWCKNAQTLIAGLDDDADITVTSSTSLTAYSETKPAIESSTIEVNAFEWQGANANELRGPSIFNEEVWCKMKMQSSLPTGIAATGQPATCKDVNEAAVEWALGQLTTEERESYDAEAPALTYADDVLYETRFEWLDESNVQFDGTTLKSSRITVELTRTDLPEEYRGVHYCKVWSPARALLWTLAFE